MPEMFEITPDDISLLNDAQLRTLVGLLCEAELRSRGYSTVAATWGGNQTAKDGGLDVRVSLPAENPIDGFIPRRATGFQVKKQDMPASAVTAEMRPKGTLRPIFKELADSEGAYIIVSSEDTTSDTALKSRRQAMAEAVSELPNTSQLALDFYDRTRLASWVRNHSGITVWARGAIGRELQGWEPFGAWAYPKGGIDAEYLMDDGIRVCPRPVSSEGDLSTKAALERIRGLLAQHQSVVRIVGLSGVGKTRLVQALFDSRIGTASLDPSLAIYANMNNAPNPQPFSLASDLIASGMRAILIVDNCAADLHRRLAELVKKESSALSILTVEYDIRDDQPEGTEVFEVQVASAELIEALLRQRFPALSQVNARTAAEFSGGNARIAIALADTVEKSGTLAGLSDDEMFQRLFVQRHQHDKSLLESAQACSLVYSYNGEDLSNDETGELAKLGAIIGFTAQQMFSATSELLDRELAQRRSVWRAILPHAVANRLAAMALRKLPAASIETNLFIGATERLLASFSRRLGYLHTSPEAHRIVSKWLEPDGWMRDVWDLNQFGKTVFQNILPVDPEAVLTAIERGVPVLDCTTPISIGQHIPRVLRSLAYDAALFDRSIALLAMLAVYGSQTISKEAGEIHASLFHLYLSGTHATVEQRLGIARKLLDSGNPAKIKLGYAALDALLQAFHFNSHFDFKFGARSRDYGYQPKVYGDITHWYSSVLSGAMELLRANKEHAAAIQPLIASNFRGLWARGRIREELKQAMLEIARQEFWREGWLAVKQTRFFDEKDNKSDNFAHLSALEAALRPANLCQNVRGRIFQKRGGSYDLYDTDEAGDDTAAGIGRTMDRQAAEAIGYGESVAADDQVMRELLPEIVSNEGYLLWQFGIGLMRGAQDKRALWMMLAAQLSSIPEADRNVQALRGMMSELHQTDPKLASELLDDAVGEDSLAPYFPVIQMAVPLDHIAIERLLLSLEGGRAAVWIFGNLAFGGVTATAEGADLARLLETIAQKPDGVGVATSILHMRFYGDNSDKRPHAPELIEVGRELLKSVDFANRSRRNDHDYCDVAKVALQGDGGHATALEICRRMKLAFQSHNADACEHSPLLRGIFTAQPRAALDTFLTGDGSAKTLGIQMIQDASDHQPNPVMAVSVDTLLEWCSHDPSARFPALASVVSAFTRAKEEDPPQWTPIALQLIQEAPDPIAVVREFTARFRPMSWSGSRAAILDTNVTLLDLIDIEGKPALATFVASERTSLKEEADRCRKWEDENDRGRDERFE